MANFKELSKEEPVAPVPDPAAHATDNDDEEVEIKHDDVVTKTPQIEVEVQSQNPYMAKCSTRISIVTLTLPRRSGR